jgi:hypothetical protein
MFVSIILSHIAYALSTHLRSLRPARQQPEIICRAAAENACNLLRGAVLLKRVEGEHPRSWGNPPVRLWLQVFFSPAGDALLPGEFVYRLRNRRSTISTMMPPATATTTSRRNCTIGVTSLSRLGGSPRQRKYPTPAPASRETGDTATFAGGVTPFRSFSEFFYAKTTQARYAGKRGICLPA